MMYTNIIMFNLLELEIKVQLYMYLKWKSKLSQELQRKHHFIYWKVLNIELLQ